MPWSPWPSVHPSCAGRSEVVLLPFLALRWSEPGMGGWLIASSPSNNLDASPPDLEGEGRRSPIWFLQVVASLSAGLGGWPGCLSCSDRDLELKQARGCCAAAIFCQFGGRSSTSGVEAISQPGHGSSKPALCEVMRSPRKAGGPWLRLIAGRGLPSLQVLVPQW
jgi:hypothetical protein